MDVFVKAEIRFWMNALGRELNVLADLALVLMKIPLAEVDNEHIFSLKRHMIGIHPARASTEVLHARAWIKVHPDPK
jgi:hypothetical protein